MDAGSLFKVANLVALVGWVMMAVAPRWQITHWVVYRGTLPVLLSVFYLILVVTTFGQAEGNFLTLAGVSSLFKNERVLLLGWVHYLVFDLVIGSWALRDSWERNISHTFMLPILLVILMLGPIGYLVYQIVRVFRPKVEPETTSVA